MPDSYALLITAETLAKDEETRAPRTRQRSHPAAILIPFAVVAVLIALNVTI